MKELNPPLIFDKKRFRVKECPCGKSNKDGKFIPYEGYQDKGYCHACDITFMPNPTHDKPFIQQPIKSLSKAKPVSYIPIEMYKASLKNYNKNHFVAYLIKLFGIHITNELIAKYNIGTSKHWTGATVFWQIDQQNKIVTGKIMLYDPQTGKRVKEPFDHIFWAHTALRLPDFNIKQLLFGEHLLTDKSRPVALVESEKTAVVASAYLPQFIWLATGGISNLTMQRCSILKGRTVILFPDLNGFEKWTQKAHELSSIGKFIVSDLLERKATEIERKDGLDLADYLERFKYTDFSQNPNTVISPSTEMPLEVILYDNLELEVLELEKFFNSIAPP